MARTLTMQTDLERPLALVIFGGTGDLSFRKLLPALYMAHLHGSLPTRTRIVASGRQKMTTDEFRQQVDQRSRAFVLADALSDEAWQRFIEHIRYVSIDVNDNESYAEIQEGSADGEIRAFYLATAPSLFTTICRNLDEAGLIDTQSRVVLEKPLGHDLESAQAINDAVARHFDEKQIYRIDHYLGKETVQNLMVLRFGNAILEPLWRAPFVRSIQITVSETLGVGSRAAFYDETGALRDMIQNHLLQLLCIVAMEAPVSLDPDDVRDEKRKVLRSLRRMSADEINRHTVRGQYRSGVVDGQQVPGYPDEQGVPAHSPTETFVALRARIDNPRWAGVPIFLRTGKRMQSRFSEIIIDFAEPPFSIFGPSQSAANRLIIRLQPQESIQLQMMMKEPGSGMKRRPVTLDLDLHEAFEARRAEAYERLLIDVLKGRLTHFMRRDELEAAWTWVDPIIRAWRESGVPPKPYAAGTWGPAAASALIATDGLAWHEESAP
jgi:glucose-6-phosphate 1-dehydrogenase